MLKLSRRGNKGSKDRQTRISSFFKSPSKEVPDEDLIPPSPIPSEKENSEKESAPLEKKAPSLKRRMLGGGGKSSSLSDSTKTLFSSLKVGSRKRKKSESEETGSNPPQKRASLNTHGHTLLKESKSNSHLSEGPPEPASPHTSILEDPDDLALACLDDSPLNSPSKTKHIEPHNPYNRQEIRSITFSDREIRLETTMNRIVVLRGSWVNNSPVLQQGDVIHVLNPLEEEEQGDRLSIIDDLHGLLVVQPDHLISGTSVVASLFCMRKAVLNERYRGLEGPSKTMFIGTVVHALLQDSLKNGVNSLDGIKGVLSEILKSPPMILDMATLQMSPKDLVLEVDPYMPHILYFIQRYVQEKDVSVPEQAFAPLSRKAPPLPPSKWPGRVESIKDIEENIWSPRLGLKGKVDLTLRVTLHKRDKRGREKKILPLELKTGRPSGSAEHRGQVIMYSMIMSERREDPEAGLLLYLRNSSLLEVNAGIHEMRGLVQLRNQLVAHLLNLDYRSLPEPINLKTACEKCPHLMACSASMSPELSFGESHAMNILIPDSLKHLNQRELEFFDRWNRMIALENAESRASSRVKELWLKTPQERRKNHQALCDLILIRENELKHSFRGDIPTSNPPFIKGELVIVSTERAIALAQGTVYRMGMEVIEVILDRNLFKDEEWKSCSFTIDKYEYIPSSAALVNLAKLMSGTEASKRLRSLIIDEGPVEFLQGLPKEVALNGKSILKTLNRVQQKAVFKTLMAKDSVCLQGMPGTGKTTLIVSLIRLLALTLKKSVLLTSYTNSAVDNALIKLLSFGDVDFVRLGKRSRISPKLYNHLFDSQSEIDHLVVGTTCLGLNHPAVQSRRFDYCILDEAGQAALMPSMGPLFHADVFVLVGDPDQLQPVVKSSEARKLGMSQSIFSILSRSNNVLPLSVQYRMNARIMEAANVLTYEGNLECGSNNVASNVIQSIPFTPEDPKWMKEALDSSLDKSVMFIDSRGSENRIGAYEITNHSEVDIIERLYKRVEEGGYDIGIIAPYRAQVSLLRRRFPQSDVNTVDQFQGKDKDIIFYSCTRSHASSKENSESILNDERRLNVAITRAKRKMIFVGNRETLKRFTPFGKLLNTFLKEEHILSTSM